VTCPFPLKAQPPEFDRFAGSYESELRRALLPGLGEGAKYARIKAEHLRRRIAVAFGMRSDPSLLDAGCGVGLTDEILKPSFPRLAGFDVSPESIRLARSRNPELRYEVSSGSSFPFGDGEFDVVFAICVVHHILPEQREKFFREAYRVLRAGGLFFLYEHNPWNPLTRFVVSRCSFDQDASLLSPRLCRRLLKQGGFVPAGRGSILFLPLEAAIWQAWEARWLSRFPCGAQYFETGRKPAIGEKVG